MEAYCGDLKYNRTDCWKTSLLRFFSQITHFWHVRGMIFHICNYQAIAAIGNPSNRSSIDCQLRLFIASNGKLWVQVPDGNCSTKSAQNCNCVACCRALYWACMGVISQYKPLIGYHAPRLVRHAVTALSKDICLIRTLPIVPATQRNVLNNLWNKDTSSIRTLHAVQGCQ